MLKKYIIVLLLIFSIALTGCGRYGKKGVERDLKKKIDKLSAYKLEGDLEIVNNDDIYKYKVDASYKKPDNYKVDLVNTSNNYEQVILKNKDGVYVVTPALNKSFKFQSDWPYNNSQIYLLNSLIDDIKSDEEKEYKQTKNNYIFTTDVNYPNNKKLIKQRIIFDKKLNLKQVKVFDENNVPLMTLKVSDIDYSPTFKKNYFSVNEVLKTTKTESNIKKTSALDDTIYPLFLPSGTKLSQEEKVKKEDGNRIIMTFDGDKPFLLVEESAKKYDEMTIVPTYGEPFMMMDSFGVMTDNSLTWTSGGVEYYIVSDVLSQDELLEVAESINVLPTMK